MHAHSSHKSFGSVDTARVLTVRWSGSQIVAFNGLPQMGACNGSNRSRRFELECEGVTLRTVHKRGKGICAPWGRMAYVGFWKTVRGRNCFCLGRIHS